MFNTKTTETHSATSTPSTPSSPGAVNLIGSGTSIEGEIASDGDIRIDGKVKGTITSKSKVVIGASGSVDGDIVCENADVSGKIFGTVEAEDILFLKANAYIEGDITTTKLVVESGAKFNGNCRMGIKEIKPNSEKITPTPQLQKKEAV